MNELNWLKDAVPNPIPPDIDVTDDVMRTIRTRQSEPSAALFSPRLLLGVALASWALAGVAVLIAQQAVSAFQNPLGDLLRF